MALLVVSPCASARERSINVGCVIGSSCETIGPERRRIDERRLARHHLGEKAPADGTECQSEMMMTEVKPKARPPGQWPDNWPHVRQAGAPSKPGRGLQPPPERKDCPGER